MVGHPLVELDGNERAAITEVTLVVNGEASAPSRARIFTRERTSGTNPCTGGGWTLPKTLRTYTLRGGETLQLDYSAAPLIVGDGGHTCLAFQRVQWWTGTKMDVGMSGFYFTAG